MKTTNQMTDPDRFYDELSTLHASLDEGGSADLNARLVLILANQVGDMDTLSECLLLAAKSGSPA